MRERGPPLPGHPAGVGKQRQSPWGKANEANVTQPGGEKRNAVVRAPQSRQGPTALDQSHHPKVFEPVLGGERVQFVGVLELQSGPPANAQA